MKRLWFLPPLAGLAVLILFWDVLWRKVAFDTGSTNPPGSVHNYNFNSGFGSILIPWVLQIVSAIALLWWHTQCHVSGCYWPGLKHRTDAGDRACWRHHPHPKLTREMLLHRHHAAAPVDSQLPG